MFAQKCVFPSLTRGSCSQVNNGMMVFKLLWGNKLFENDSFCPQ